MSAALAIIGSIAAAIAGLVHLYIFALESLLWRRPSTWRVFGIRSAADADTLRPMAYNQGFYNLFLAVGVALGLVLVASGTRADAGYGVLLFALASMVLAALVLVTSNRRMLRAALVQGVAPALAIVALAAGLLAG